VPPPSGHDRHHRFQVAIEAHGRVTLARVIVSGQG
jgi:hypothetical protein